MAQNTEKTRSSVTLYGEDAALLHKLKAILQAKHPVKMSLTDVVHVALNKLYELETNN